MTFAQFKASLLIGLVGISLSLGGVVYADQANTVRQQGQDIVDLKLIVTELRGLVQEQARTGDRVAQSVEKLTEIVDDLRTRR